MRVLALLLARAGLPTPTPAQVARTGPDTVPVPGFLEALEVQPLVLTAGEGVRIAVEVTAWGRRVSPGATDPQGGQGRPWGYRLEVESPPPFLRNLRWEDGAEGSVPAGLRSSEAHLRFDVDPLPAGGPGSAELVLLVRAQDPGAVPGERRIVIPLELRTRPAAVVSAHPVRWEAQVEFAGVDDPEPFSRVLAEEPPLVFDGVWVFFTPAVDTLRDFSWRIVGPDEGVVTSGHFLQEAEENSTRRAGPGAPGAFVAPLARGRVWSPGDRNRGAGPGTYRLETCGEYDVEAGVGGVFGAGAGLPPCLRWQEEGSFPVGARQLHFKGMVLEEGPAKVDDRWGDLALPPGVFQLLDPNRDPSSRLVRFRAEWYAPAGQAYVPPQPPVDWNSVAALEALVRERFPGGDLRQVITQGPEGGTRTVLAFRQELGGTLEVAFPELLDPLSDTLGTLAARLEVQGSGLVARDCYGVTLQNPTSPCTGLNALAPGV